MRYVIFLTVLMAFFLAGCSSVYRAGQTPDDVYYSPEPEGAYVVVKTQKDPDDRYLRWKIKNRRWNALDDFSYWNDSRYGYGYNYVHHYGAGIYPSYVYYYPVKYPSYYNVKPSRAPISAYTNTSYQNSNPRYNSKAPAQNQSMFRKVFSAPPTSSSPGRSVNNPIRSFESSSSPSGQAGGRSGGYNSGSTGKTGGRN